MADSDRHADDGDRKASKPYPQKALADYLEELLADVEEVAAQDGEEDGDGEEGSDPASHFSSATQQGQESRSSARSRPGSGGSAPLRQPAAQPEQQSSGQRLAERDRLPQMPLPREAPAQPAESEETRPQSKASTPPSRETSSAAAQAAQAEQQREKLPQTSIAAGGGRYSSSDPVPSWAHPWFQAMIFHIGPLQVAVPLVKLQRVLRWDTERQVEPYAGQPHWIHGALYHRRRFVRVVDTAELVLPTQHRPAPEERRYGKLLVVGDGSWALACQEVGEVFRLTPKQVQWRSEHGRQRWLAGTVSERLCALLDTDAFTQLLESEDDLQGALATSLDPGQTVARRRK